MMGIRCFYFHGLFLFDFRQLVIPTTHESIRGALNDFFFITGFLYFPNVATCFHVYASLEAKTTCRAVLMQISHNSWPDLNDDLYF